jgi:hypothetical protein
MDYFSNFLKLAPQGKVDQSTIRLLSPDVALHSGVYSFTLNPAEGETKLVQVRWIPYIEAFVTDGPSKAAEEEVFFSCESCMQISNCCKNCLACWCGQGFLWS